MPSVTIEIGSTPCEEECAQVGTDDYSVRARKECKAYINQLRRFIVSKGFDNVTIESKIRLLIKSNSHDFGTYHEVACRFDESNEEACNIAYMLEGNGPTRWDALARAELGLFASED